MTSPNRHPRPLRLEAAIAPLHHPPDPAFVLECIAEHLHGNWIFEEGALGNGHLIGSGGERLTCVAAKGRLAVEGRFPVIDHWIDTSPRITVSIDKRPAVIARDIERRLLPAYRSALAPALEHQAARERLAQEAKKQTAELASLLRHRWRRTTNRLGHPRLEADAEFLTDQSRFDINPNDATVTIQLRSTPTELAKAVARVVAEAEDTARRAETTPNPHNTENGTRP